MIVVSSKLSPPVMVCPCSKKKKAETKTIKISLLSREEKKNLSLENPGIDPGTSRMLSGRSTIWANSPEYVNYLKVVSPLAVTE